MFYLVMSGCVEDRVIWSLHYLKYMHCFYNSNYFLLQQVFNATTEIQASSSYHNIRILQVLRNSSSTPIQEPPLDTSWQIAGPSMTIPQGKYFISYIKVLLVHSLLCAGFLEKIYMINIQYQWVLYHLIGVVPKYNYGHLLKQSKLAVQCKYDLYYL